MEVFFFFKLQRNISLPYLLETRYPALIIKVSYNHYTVFSLLQYKFPFNIIMWVNLFQFINLILNGFYVKWQENLFILEFDSILEANSLVVKGFSLANLQICWYPFKDQVDWLLPSTVLYSIKPNHLIRSFFLIIAWGNIWS